MLYQIYEAQRSLIEPFADLAEAAAKLYGNPHSMAGQLPMAQRVRRLRPDASAGQGL